MSVQPVPESAAISASPPVVPPEPKVVSPVRSADSSTLAFTPNRAELWRLNDAKGGLQNAHRILSAAQDALVEIQRNVGSMMQMANESSSVETEAGRRSELEQEYRRLTSRIDHVAQNSGFGAVNLLKSNGSSDRIVVRLQVGSGRSENLHVTVKASDASGLGLKGSSVLTSTEAARAQAVLQEALSNLNETADAVNGLQGRVDWSLSGETTDSRPPSGALKEWRNSMEGSNHIAVQAKMRAMLNVLATGRGLAESVTFLTS
ncbi:MAG: hypothetical protein HONBIEJF_01943 [Fimbriimonadaceae bacterium]|nr:hypothetical protein [Fimbriimonadaceae bacterium]